MANKTSDPGLNNAAAAKLLGTLKNSAGKYSDSLRKQLKKLREKNKYKQISAVLKQAGNKQPQYKNLLNALQAADDIAVKLSGISKDIDSIGASGEASAEEISGRITEVLENHGIPPEKLRTIINSIKRVDKRILHDRLSAAGLERFLVMPVPERTAGAADAADKPAGAKTGSGKNPLRMAVALLKNPEAAKLLFECVSTDSNSGPVKKEFIDCCSPDRMLEEYSKYKTRVEQSVREKFDKPVQNSESADSAKQTHVFVRILNYLKELHDFNILKRKDLYKSAIIIHELFTWFDSNEIKNHFLANDDVCDEYQKINRMFSVRTDRLDFVFAFEIQVIQIFEELVRDGQRAAGGIIRKAKTSASRMMKKSEYYKDLGTPLLKNLQVRISHFFNHLSAYYVPSGTEKSSAAGGKGSPAALARPEDFDSFADKQHKKISGFIGDLKEIEEFRQKERQIIDGFNSDLEKENINQLFEMVDDIPLFRSKKQLVTYGELLRQLIEGPLKNKSPWAKISILDRIIENFEQSNKPEILIDRLKYFRSSIEREPRLLKELMSNLKTRGSLEDHVSYLLRSLSDENLSLRAPNLLLRLYGLVSAIQSNDSRFVEKMTEEINKLPVWKQEIVYQYITELEEKFKGNKQVSAGIVKIKTGMEANIELQKSIEEKAAAEQGKSKEDILLANIDDFLGRPEFALDNMEGLETGDIDFDMGGLDDIGETFSEDLASISIHNAAEQVKERKLAGRSLDQILEKDQVRRIVDSPFADRLRILEKKIEEEDDPSYYQEILEVSKRIFYEIDPLQEVDDKIGILQQWKQVDYADKEYIRDFIDKQLEQLNGEKATAGMLSELYRQLAALESKGEQIDFLKSRLTDPEYEKHKAVITRLIHQITTEPQQLSTGAIDRYLSDLDENDNEQLKEKKEGLQRLSARAEEDEILNYIENKSSMITGSIQKIREEEEETTLKYLAGQSKKEQEKSDSFKTFPAVAELIMYAREQCKSPGARQKFIREQELYFSEHPEAAAADYPETLRLIRYLFSPLSEEGSIRLKSLIGRQDSKFIDFDGKVKLLHILKNSNEIYEAMNIDPFLIPQAAVRLSLLHSGNKSKNQAQKLLFLRETLPGNESYCSKFDITRSDIRKVIDEIGAKKQKNEQAGEAVPESTSAAADLRELNKNAPQGQLGTTGGEEEVRLSRIVKTERAAKSRKLYQQFKEAIDNDVQIKLKQQANRERIEQIKDKAHQVYEQFQKDTNKVLNGLLQELQNSEVETMASVLSDTLLPVFRKKLEHEYNEQEKQKLQDIVSKLENINRYVIGPCLTNKSDSINLESLCSSVHIDPPNRVILEGIIGKLEEFWEQYLDHFAENEAADSKPSPVSPAEPQEKEGGFEIPEQENIFAISDLPQTEEEIMGSVLSSKTTEQPQPPADFAAPETGQPADEPEPDIDAGVLQALLGLSEFVKPHKVIIDSAHDRTKYSDNMDLRTGALNSLHRQKRIFSYDEGKTYIGEGKIVDFYKKHKNDRLFSRTDRFFLVDELKKFLDGFGNDSDDNTLQRKCRFLGIDYTADNYSSQYQQFMNSLSAWKEQSAGPRPGTSVGKARTASASGGGGKASAAAGRTKSRDSAKTSSAGKRKSSVKSGKSASGRKAGKAAAGEAASPAKAKGGSAQNNQLTAVHSEMIKHISKRKKKITQVLVNMIDNLYTKEELVNMNTLYLGQQGVKVSRKLNRVERNRNILELISKFSIFNPTLLTGILEDEKLLSYDGYFDKKQIAAAVKRKLKALG